MSKQEFEVVKIDSTTTDTHLNINDMEGGKNLTPSKNNDESQSEISDITTTDTSSETEKSSSSDNEDTTSIATTELIKLAEDPLFLVLGQFLVNKKDENIAEVLEKINNNLSKITDYLEIISKKN